MQCLHCLTDKKEEIVLFSSRFSYFVKDRNAIVLSIFGVNFTFREIFNNLSLIYACHKIIFKTINPGKKLKYFIEKYLIYQLCSILCTFIIIT